jgi:TetR/AcrR family transcriptional regulator
MDDIKPRRRSRIREAHEARILAAAEDVFAQYGYNGASVETIAEQAGTDPAAMLENYIRGKFEISRTHPNGSKVFANEIINGAPHLREYLRQRLLPQLEADIALVRGWIAQGLVDPIEPEHLFFTIWASTQTYADFSAQIELALGKDSLEADDFTRAGDFLTQVILKGIGLKV